MLNEQLRLAFPEYPIPNPPIKDKTATIAAPQPVANAYSYYNPLRAFYGASPRPSSPAVPASPSLEPADSANLASASSSELPSSPASPAPSVPLSRERNRLTLRAYLQSLMAQPFLNSPVLRSFLLSGPTTLTPAEAVDCQRRLEADAVREEGRRRFRQEAEKRIEALREGLSQFKGDMLNRRGGLKAVFEVVRRVDRVEDLPKAEASVLEWGRISWDNPLALFSADIVD